jgi:hypothetical protein
VNIQDCVGLPVMCMQAGCLHEANQYWWVKVPTGGMVERLFCYQHASENRAADIMAFADDFIAGSDQS